VPIMLAERGPNSITKDEIERRCKEAWVAMNRYGDYGLEAGDVGGVAPTREMYSFAVIVRLFYVDRGEEFQLKLYRELRIRFNEYDMIQLIPTQKEDWFADPVWAVVREGEWKEEKDKCVLCHKETPYDKNTHIDLREHYVEGLGQLCKECWYKTDGSC